MLDGGIELNIGGGGQAQGVIGAGVVQIENFNVYNRPAEEPPHKFLEPIPPCPYPGLASFGPHDSHLFFGRDAAIARLAEAVSRQSFTALVGASGSGKSSVVLAGLAPRLHTHGNWRFTHFHISQEPDCNPFMALARALAPLLLDHSAIDQLASVQRLATDLEIGSVTLKNALGGCRAKNPGKQILIVADQFEEIFTLMSDEERRRRFIDALLAGFSHKSGCTGSPHSSIILTLRGDFYGAALRYRRLSDTLQDHIENLAPMTREELQEAIRKPAGDVRFESGLVETLLDAVDKRPGSLPLLQFVLRELWVRQERRCITRASYDAIGRVEGAVARRAQAIYNEVTNNGNNVASSVLFRRLVTRLVNLGDRAEDTRRVVDRRELGPDAWALAQRLAGERNRLITITSSRQGRETAEVVHEAVIQNWPTLADWIKIDRHFHSWLRQLKPRIEEWHKDPNDEGPLLRGNILLAAEAWLANRGDELNEDERSFIKASIAQRDESLRNTERHRRLARRFIEVVATSIILLMGLSAFHLWVINNNRNATWEMGWRGVQMRAWLLLHKPPEPMMADIPGGSFKMGSRDNEGGAFEHPQHTVRLGPFKMSEYDITFEQYDLFAAATLREMPSDRGWGRGNRPVINVSWEDANDYIKWLNQKTGRHYRLPSEAEWEYAARAGTTTTYWWGAERDKRDGDRPHCDGCGSKFDGVETAPVGSFDPNPWNLYDMAGNVWQWTADCWHESYVLAPNDGQIWTDESGGTCNSRVVRGGSWTGNPLDRRAAERLNVGNSGTESDLGFRLACDADGPPHH